jgi:hypothetical protein
VGLTVALLRIADHLEPMLRAKKAGFTAARWRGTGQGSVKAV